MSLTSWFLTLLASLAMASASFLLRLSIDRVGGFYFTTNSILKLVAQPMFLFGLIFYAFSVGCWFKIIASEKLSVAYPLMITLTFALVSLGSVIILKEAFTLVKAIGLLLIVVGIFLTTR
jgi:multidrug transporter EmrE-like cation transporter